MAAPPNQSCPLRVIEFYSGLGGMHYALLLSKVPAEVVAAVDINDIANKIYRFNFPEINLLQRNIQSVSLKEFTKLDADMFLMSPPCQPFTRVGLRGDRADPRTASFLSLLDTLPKLTKKPQYILVENVKGFETSETRNQLVQVLQNCNYRFKEFLLSPTHVGIPNQRLRYFLLAKLHPLRFSHSCNARGQSSLLQHEIFSTGHPNHEGQEYKVSGMGNDEASVKGERGGLHNETDHDGVRSDGSDQPGIDYGCTRQSESIPEEASRGAVPSSGLSNRISAESGGLSDPPRTDHHSVSKGRHDLNHSKSGQGSEHLSPRVRGEVGRTSANPSNICNGRLAEGQCLCERTGLLGGFHEECQISVLDNRSQCNNEDSVVHLMSIGAFLETLSEAEMGEYLVPDKLLLRFGRVMDIVTEKDDKTCCFTKAYGHYIEGTGSFLQTDSSVSLDWAFAEGLEKAESLSRLKQLRLRYFTPREIANLHCFPEEFCFPADVTRKQRCRVLGNSLNAYVVSLLLDYLIM